MRTYGGNTDYPTFNTFASSTTVTLKPPSDADNAVRIVRWGLADVLRWLGENVGPRPNDPWSTVASFYPFTNSGALSAKDL